MNKEYISHLAEGKLFEKSFALVGFTENEIIGKFNLCTGILGSDQRLEGPEVFWVGIQGLKKINTPYKYMMFNCHFGHNNVTDWANNAVMFYEEYFL